MNCPLNSYSRKGSDINCLLAMVIAGRGSDMNSLLAMVIAGRG